MPASSSFIFYLLEENLLLRRKIASIGLLTVEKVARKGVEEGIAIVPDESLVNCLPRIAEETVFEV